MYVTRVPIPNPNKTFGMCKGVIKSQRSFVRYTWRLEGKGIWFNKRISSGILLDPFLMRDRSCGDRYTRADGCCYSYRCPSQIYLYSSTYRVLGGNSLYKLSWAVYTRLLINQLVITAIIVTTSLYGVLYVTKRR